MTDAKLNYLGPIPKALTYSGSGRPWWRKVPVAFLLVVVLPTLLAVIYYGLIATPRYVSEARFLVRTPSQSQPTGLGVALQGVGLSAGQSDAFAVHEYIDSRDGMLELGRSHDLRRIFSANGADFLSRFPRPFQSTSNEDLFKAYQRFVTVGYDSTSGISTLRVEAFTPRQARNLSEGLLAGGERLVNRLNERAATDAIHEAQTSQLTARQRLADAQAALTAFRNREQFIDPSGTATESSRLVGSLLETVANLKAERSQIASEAPQSPQLAAVDGRIAAFERQITQERAKITGTSGSLASKLSEYEALNLAREFADRELTQATIALVTAEQDARRQRLYLDRVVNPSMPDKAGEPKRLIAILTVLLSALMIYGVGWLIWSGVREHEQA